MPSLWKDDKPQKSHEGGRGQRRQKKPEDVDTGTGAEHGPEICGEAEET